MHRSILMTGLVKLCRLIYVWVCKPYQQSWHCWEPTVHVLRWPSLLQHRGCTLLGINACPDLESQKQRFLNGGFSNAWALDMMEVYRLLPPADTHRCVLDTYSVTFLKCLTAVLCLCVCVCVCWTLYSSQGREDWISWWTGIARTTVTTLLSQLWLYWPHTHRYKMYMYMYIQ